MTVVTGKCFLTNSFKITTRMSGLFNWKKKNHKEHRIKFTSLWEVCIKKKSLPKLLVSLTLSDTALRIVLLSNSRHERRKFYALSWICQQWAFLQNFSLLHCEKQHSIPWLLSEQETILINRNTTVIILKSQTCNKLTKFPDMEKQLTPDISCSLAHHRLKNRPIRR